MIAFEGNLTSLMDVLASQTNVCLRAHDIKSSFSWEKILGFSKLTKASRPEIQTETYIEPEQK